MGSTRFPGKSMMKLAGEPLVGRILERIKRCALLTDIVLAIPETKENDILRELAERHKVFVFRGAENDLVDRYYRAAKQFSADIILRLPADNPVPEPAEIDRILNFHLNGTAHFSSNLSQVYGNGYPDGIGAEVFDFKSLEEIWKSTTDPLKREHLHLNFFDYKTQKPAVPEKYSIGTVTCPAAFRRPDLILDVNTRDQYNFFVKLYDYLYPRNPEFHITDIIHWYDNIYKKS